MPPNLIELRPDPKLIKSNFDGYKLSLEPIPIIKYECPVQPDRILQSESQYSFLHANIFFLQNHLVRDSWLPGSSYYIDENLEVQKIEYDEKNGRLKPIQCVYKVPKQRDREPNDYNLSFIFISEKYCLLSNGIGSMQLIETDDRRKNKEWKCSQNFHQLLENQWEDNSGNFGFLIQDARFEIVANEKQIHCLLLHVQQNDKTAFECVIDWLTLKLDTVWKVATRRTLKGKNYPYYCSLGNKSKSIVLTSSANFEFIYDSEFPIVIPENSPDENVKTEFLFEWSQTGEELILKFKEKDACLADYKINYNEKKLQVNYKDKILIDSELFGAIENDLTTWSIENKFLQVVLVKKTAELPWPSIFPDSGPNETFDINRLENMRNDEINNGSAQPVSTLISQVEDCDIDSNRLEQDFFIERFDRETHEITHRVYLGNNPPLFNVTLRPGYPSALVLRHDVDSCVWLQSNISNNWTFKHEGTLNAFGYVQASKQQKKFVSCSPDLNYGIICEPERHVFIYKGNYNSASGLRKRTGPQVSIGQQKLVTLDSTGEVLGIVAENDITILLTEKFVICMQLCIEE